MLSVIFRPTLDLIEEYPNFVAATSSYFDNFYEDEWLDDDFVRKCIEQIDKKSLGDLPTEKALLEYGMRPEDLRGGTKNLILRKFTDTMGNLLQMGSNCYNLLMDIAKSKDVVMGSGDSVLFTDSDIRGQDIYFPQLDLVVSTALDFNEGIAKCIDRGYL